MYENIGQKLKTLAIVEAVIVSVASIVSGIILTFYDDFILVGILTATVGTLLAWVSSWVLYAIGETAENVAEIKRMLKSRQNASTQGAPSSASSANKQSSANTVETRSKVLGGASSSDKTKLCPHCGEVVKTNTCAMCGKKNNLF